MNFVAQTFMGKQMRLRDSDHCLTLDQLKCAENLGEHKVVLTFCLLKSIVQWRYLHIQYITAHSFTLSSLCGAFDAALTLSSMERAPSCLPVLLWLSSLDWYMAVINCKWVILRERRGLCDKVIDWGLLKVRVSVSYLKDCYTPQVEMYRVFIAMSKTF